ncbi:MAG: hypothetical protein AAF658_09440, partial [Myxococcota bacterium]
PRKHGKRIVVGSVRGNQVLLRAGSAMGLTPGTELASGSVRIRVDSVGGPTLSSARVIAGDGSRIHPGALFEVFRWAPPESRALQVAVRDCPNAEWCATLRSKLQARSLAKLVDGAETADYQLRADPGSDTRRYFWERPLSGYTPLPFKTDPVSSVDALVDQANRLARLLGWLTLESPPEGTESFPYTLALRDERGRLKVSGTVGEGETYDLALVSTRRVPRVERRWVYVFLIDNSGQSILLYPDERGDVENQFPPPKRRALGSYVLNSPFRVIPPYGVETFVLLSSREKLTDPAGTFSSEPLRTAKGAPASSLATLLNRVGTRGDPLSVSTDWAVSRVTVLSKGTAPRAERPTP